MITAESHSLAMFNSTCRLLKGSALTDSLDSAGNTMLGGDVRGEGSSLGFEMDLYIHPLRGKHPRLTKTTHRHKQSHMHGHAFIQRHGPRRHARSKRTVISMDKKTKAKTFENILRNCASFVVVSEPSFDASAG